MNLLDELEKEDRLAGKLDRLGTYRRKRGLYLGREDVSIKAPFPARPSSSVSAGRQV